jgi:hypothetical protein
MLADRVDEQARPVRSRRIPEARRIRPGDRVLLHVLAHVEADELVAEVQRQLFGRAQVLPTPVGPVKRKQSRGAFRLSEAGARAA